MSNPQFEEMLNLRFEPGMLRGHIDTFICNRCSEPFHKAEMLDKVGELMDGMSRYTRVANAYCVPCAQKMEPKLFAKFLKSKWYTKFIAIKLGVR